MIAIIKVTWLSTIVKVVIIIIPLFIVPNNEVLLHYVLGALVDKVSIDPVMIPSLLHKNYENHIVLWKFCIEYIMPVPFQQHRNGDGPSIPIMVFGVIIWSHAQNRPQ